MMSRRQQLALFLTATALLGFSSKCGQAAIQASCVESECDEEESMALLQKSVALHAPAESNDVFLSWAMSQEPTAPKELTASSPFMGDMPPLDASSSRSISQIHPNYARIHNVTNSTWNINADMIKVMASEMAYSKMYKSPNATHKTHFAATESEAEAFPSSLVNDGVPDTAANRNMAKGMSDSQKYAGELPTERAAAPVKMGPIFGVYLKYPGGKPDKPEKTPEEIKTYMYGADPSWAGCVKFSSWGQTTLDSKDVFIYEMDSTIDPNTWTAGGKMAFPTAWAEVKKMQAFKDGLRKAFQKIGEPKRFMMFLPGTGFEATAWNPGTESDFIDGAITWQTMAHEVGHNWGLDHAGGFLAQGFHPYADDAVMGFQRVSRASDYSAPARYNLGWIPQDQVALYPHHQTTKVRALNEGPKADDSAVLMMLLDCPDCVSGNPYNKNKGGTLFASFRVEDPKRPYGLDLQDFNLREIGTFEKLTLVDRLSIHFQPYRAEDGGIGKTTELWTTLGKKETFKAPQASLAIHVCDSSTGGSTEWAKISAGTTSSQAESGCTFAWGNSAPIPFVGKKPADKKNNVWKNWANIFKKNQGKIGKAAREPSESGAYRHVSGAVATLIVLWSVSMW